MQRGKAPGDANHQKVEATRTNLAQGFRDARDRAPNARIIAVGCGTYLPPRGCPETLGLFTASEADYLQGLIDHLSDVIGEVAASEGIEFADLRDVPGRLEHTACADFDDQWIRGVDVGNGTDGMVLHPSSAGMASTARHLGSVIGLPATTSGTTAAREEARAALSAARLRATCYQRSDSHPARTRLRVGGASGRITAVVFRVGKHVIATDRHGPYRATVNTRRLRRLEGRPKARVTVHVRKVVLRKTLRVRRPGCLR